MASRPRDQKEIPHGGAATAYGVLYQMLWSVFQAQKQAANCEILAADLDETGRDLRNATFVVEPPGGGDLIRGRIVDQIKSRPGGRPWSFEEVLGEVLTDLYRAALTGVEFTGYRLVTEGRIGRWQRVLRFFEGLAQRPEPSDGLSTLDDKEPLVRGNVLRSIGGPATQRRIFDHVVEVIRRQVRRAAGEPLETTQRRVWRMLGRFQVESVQWDELEASIDHEIRLRGCSDGLVVRTRRALVGGLLEAAKKSTWRAPGRLDPAAFLKEHGLDGLRVSDRATLLEHSRQHLDRCLKTYGYDRGSDVRRDTVGLHPWRHEETVDGQQALYTEKPVVLFTGESRQDEVFFRLADDLAKAGELVLLSFATGSVEGDCEKAARIFCREIWGHGYEISLSRLTRRLRDAIPEVRQSRITLLIHGIASEDYANQLIRYPWEDHGLRLAVSFRGNSQWIPAAADRRQLVPVGHLTPEEIAALLGREIGPDWVLIPSDVREILKYPLLVQLYLETAATRPSWNPTQEYELFEAHWSRHLDSAPVEVDAIAEVASLLPEERRYPWPVSRLRTLRIRSQDLHALEQRKLLRRTLDGRLFEIADDRILNWAAAEGLVARLRDGRLAAQEIPERALACRAPATETAGRWLGYVPLDVLWLLTDPSQRQGEAVEAFLDALETNVDRRRVLQGLPTLGPRIVPYLVDRLRRHAEGRRGLRYRYRDLLIETADESIPERILDLLRPRDVPRRLQEVAAEILARKPTAAALDRLWALRCEAEGEDPQDEDRGSPYWLRDQLEKALRACVRTAGTWLEATIRRSDPAHEPFAALVYLLPWVAGGRDLWSGTKETILAKLPAPGERAAAVCIETFRDESEAPWLRARFHHSDGTVAAMALQAYKLLRPEEPPPEELDVATLDRLSLTRSWWLPLYLLDDPEAMSSLVLRRMRESDEPWDVADDVYSGRENAITPEILRLLLEQTAALLRSEVESPSPEDGEPLWRHFRFLARIARRDLLDVFSELAGSGFEQDLVTLLERRGPGEGAVGRPFENRALAVLEKIGSTGLTRLANFYLAQGQSRWARDDGRTRAVRRPDEETARLLQVLARGEVDSSDDETDFPWEQVKAVETLADLGEWRAVVEGVVRLGLRFSYEFAERFPSQGLSNADLQPALEALEGEEPPPGAILAVGYARRHELVPRLHHLLRQVEPESDTAQACLLALEILADTSAETEESFLEHLHFPRNRYVAWRALLTRIRTPRAFQALLGLFRELKGADYGLAQLTAMNLLEIEETRREMAAILWEDFGGPTERWHLIDYAGPAIEHLASLETAEVRSTLLQVALGDDRYPGQHEARLSAIDGVAEFDPQRAFDAARRLMLAQFPQREQCPERLLRYNTEGALDLFEEIVRESGDFLLLAAIGEALDRAGLTSRVQDWLRSPDPALRRGACFVAEAMGWTDDLDQALQSCIRDEDWDVREAAKDTLEAMRRHREVEPLVEALRGEEDPARCWALVDAALEIGYVGVVPGYGQDRWFGELYAMVAPPLQRHALQQVEKREKELREALQKRKRES